MRWPSRYRRYSGKRHGRHERRLAVPTGAGPCATPTGVVAAGARLVGIGTAARADRCRPGLPSPPPARPPAPYRPARTQTPGRGRERRCPPRRRTGALDAPLCRGCLRPRDRGTSERNGLAGRRRRARGLGSGGRRGAGVAARCLRLSGPGRSRPLAERGSRLTGSAPVLHVAWPWMLLCLPLPWLLARWLPPAQPQGAALFLPFAAAVADASLPAGRPVPRPRKLLFALVWLLLVLAAIRPQWLGDPEAVAATGRRLLLAVDVSGSMANQDMAGGATRLQVVQKVAGDFLRRRHGDQVGLILFGTRPYLQAPLTPDLNTVDQFLDEAMIGVAGTQTAIGDAIGLAIKRLKADPARAGNKGDTVLILLTDGSSNAGAMPPLEAARMAAQAGLRIYTIGGGAAAQDGFFGISGNSDLDEDTLKSIAKTTGGEYFRATDAAALEQVYDRIDRLEPSAARQQWYRPRDEWFAWPLGLALLLSLPAVLWSGRAWR